MDTPPTMGTLPWDTRPAILLFTFCGEHMLSIAYNSLKSLAIG